MKKWTISLLAAMAIEAQAGDYVYRYLVVTDVQGNSTSVVTDGLRFTISDGNLVAVNNEGNFTFTLGQLASMAFSETATNTTTAVDALPVTQATTIEAYSLGGARIGCFSSMNQLKNTLAKGVYIVKQNGTTKKVTIK